MTRACLHDATRVPVTIRSVPRSMGELWEELWRMTFSAQVKASQEKKVVQRTR